MTRAASYKQRRAAQNIRPTAEVLLPSGATFLLRRPPLNVWLVWGKVPQSLLRKLASAEGAVPEDLTPEQILEGASFIGDAIIDACVSPKLVIDGTGEDELDPRELDPADFEFLAGWIMGNAPNVPIQTEEGEISTESLNRFPEKDGSGDAATSVVGDSLDGA